MFWNYEVCRLMCESFADVFDSEGFADVVDSESFPDVF